MSTRWLVFPPPRPSGPSADILNSLLSILCLPSSMFYPRSLSFDFYPNPLSSLSLASRRANFSASYLFISSSSLSTAAFYCSTAILRSAKWYPIWVSDSCKSASSIEFVGDPPDFFSPLVAIFCTYCSLRSLSISALSSSKSYWLSFFWALAISKRDWILSSLSPPPPLRLPVSSRRYVPELAGFFICISKAAQIL